MVITPKRGISSTSSGAKQGIRWPYWQLRAKVRTMFWPGTKAPPSDAHSTNEATRVAEERSWVSSHAQTGPEEGCAVEAPVYLSTSACGAAHIHWAKLAAAGAVTCTLLARGRVYMRRERTWKNCVTAPFRTAPTSSVFASSLEHGCGGQQRCGGCAVKPAGTITFPHSASPFCARLSAFWPLFLFFWIFISH